MSLLNPDAKFPYCDIFAVYLKCGTSQRLQIMFRQIMLGLYPECTDVVVPIYKDDITNSHFTYGISVIGARSFYGTFSRREVYPWQVNAICVNVPYGNIDEWAYCSESWLGMTARTLRAMWHGVRLIPNDTPMLRKSINIGIPWIPLDKSPEDCSDEELADYTEIVLASVSSQIWVKDKLVITPHVHVS